jgi:glutaredoxin
MKSDCVFTNLRTRLRWAPLVALLAALPAHAQYKVIGADGKVTYTDRPPAQNDGKVTALGARGATAPAAADATLPLELRQPVSRYPVTLYTVTGACEPCQSARTLLRQRGVPFAEKQVQSPEDSEALERISGGRDAPTLSIGAQTLRGYAPEVWTSYLDAAAYPRESRLPASYTYPAATSIVERREAGATRPAAAASAAPAPVPTAPPPANPTGIKF